MRSVYCLASVAVALALIPNLPAQAQSSDRLGVSVTGLRNDNGSVRCGLYASPNGFLEQGREFRGASAPVRKGAATCIFANLPAGTYAVAVFHAEQNETRLETGMFGKPKQGFGFSRNPSIAFRAPSFSDAAFEYRGGTSALQVRLNY